MLNAAQQQVREDTGSVLVHFINYSILLAWESGCSLFTVTLPAVSEELMHVLTAIVVPVPEVACLAGIELHQFIT